MVARSRSRLRWQVALAGLLLLAGLRLAPSLSPAIIVPASVVWLALLGYLLYTGFTILATWLSRKAAAAVMVVLVLLPLAGTAMHAPTEMALRFPCPRNWGWLPAWLLRSSPLSSTILSVDGVHVRICYGRPAARGRTMIGGSRVPFGKLWRTGANEPTTIISPIGLVVAGIVMPPGRAALYTVPGPETWELILNASTTQWGIESEYTDKVRTHELGRAIVPSETTSTHVERLTFVPDSGGVVLEWERTRVRIPIQPLSR